MSEVDGLAREIRELEANKVYSKGKIDVNKQDDLVEGNKLI